ncbi:ATP-binding protein [Flavobacterium sp. HJSW_4]|uniref:sensor histidine kinase n=1 Tax=Flavobacterium sp. HJSW_4 TaxID=3344660 RepID=UPI0035F27080
METTLQLLKDIVDHAPQPIGVYTGKELRIELANQAMVHTWGKGDAVIGRTYFEVVPEIGKQQIFEEAIWAYDTGQPFHAREKRVDLIMDGELKTFYFNYSFIPLFDSKGEVYGIMNTGVDLTDLHQAKETAQSASEQLQMALEASGMGTYEIDLATGRIATSGNFRSFWNIEGPITNEKIMAKLHPDDIAVREQAHLEAEQTGLISYQARILNEDQTIRWTKIAGKIIRDQNGKPAKITGVIEDIGRQKAMEEQLRSQAEQKTKELRRSNDELLHFANLVSHDLREPARKIRTFISRTRNEVMGTFNEKAAFYLDKIDHSAQRMQNVIEGILAYSGAEKKKQPVELIDLEQALEEIKTDLELVIQEKNAVLLSDGLPSIEGGRVLIQQLLYNLVHNALKFSRAEVPPRVVITSDILDGAEDRKVRILIKDNGIGLENDFSERIFTAFERLHSKDQYEGSGLGLSLCRKIAERHGGSITASGKTGEGSVFTLILPLKQKKDTI